MHSSVTGNSYEWYSGLDAKNNADANDWCIAQQGYLATFTTAAEANDVIAIMGFIDSSPWTWISGVGDSGLTSWSYSPGSPYTGPFYSYYSDICETFCPWEAKGPTFDDNKGQTAIVMAVRQSTFEGAVFDNVLASDINPFICEFPPTAKDFTVTLRRDSGSIPSYYLEIQTVLNIENSVATITSLSDPTAVYTSVVTAQTPLTIQLSPPFTGAYSISLLSSTNDACITDFQFKPPVISYVYPSISTNPLATIVGSNFGEDASKIKVFFDLSPPTPCTNVQLIGPSIISCNIALNVDLYPVTVEVDGVTTRSFRVPIYRDKLGIKSFYSIAMPKMTYHDSANLAVQTTVGTMSGYLGVVIDDEIKTFLKRMIPTFDTTFGDYMIYSGVRYADSKYYYKENGPDKDKEVSFSDITIDVTSPSVTDTFIFNSINSANNKLQQLPLTSDPIGLLIQAQFDQSNASPPNQLLDTDGILDFDLPFYGHIFAKCIISIDPNIESPVLTDVTTPDLSFPSKKHAIVPGHSSQESTYVVVLEGKSTATIKISYNPPTLDGSSVPQVTTAGFSGAILTGTNFFNDIGVTSLLFDGNQISPSSATFTSIVVDIPEISGSSALDLSIQVGDQTSNIISFTYQGPIIVACPSAISPIGGEVIVEGTSFGNDVGNIYLDGHPDIVITILEAHTKISFVVPDGIGVFTFSLVVYGQSSQPRTIDYSGTQVEFNQASHITIDGENFLGGRPPVVSIGGLDCPIVTSSESQIICDFAANVPINLDGDALLVNVTLGSLSAVSYTFYYKQDYTCPLDCGSNGTCDLTTGQCTCGSSLGSDCSIEKSYLTIIPPSPIISKPGSIVDVPGSESIAYSIGIQHIRELSPLGDIVRQFNISSTIWTTINTTTTTTAIYFGTFDGHNFSINVASTIYNETMPIIFAGESLTMAPNSVKQVITLKDYVFINQANRLDIIYVTKQSGASTFNQTTNTGNQDPTKLVWYDISADESILTSRFSRRMIVDNRYTRNRVSIIPLTDTLYTSGVHDSSKSTLTAMTVPYHHNEVTLDPNFALLLRSRVSLLPHLSQLELVSSLSVDSKVADSPMLP
eukprot:gene19145-22930_t